MLLLSFALVFSGIVYAGNSDVKTERVEKGVLLELYTVGNTYATPKNVEILDPRSKGYIYYGQNVQNLIIGDGVKKVGIGAFSNTSSKFDNLQSVEMKDVEIIDVNAFGGQDLLKNVVLSDNLKEIRSNAFDFTYDLKNIKLPEGLEVIGVEAFKNSGLLEVEIPATVKKIEDRAFEDCKQMTKMVIKEGVEEIGSYAIPSCKLKDLYIPESVTKIDPYAIQGNGILAVTIYTPAGSAAEKYALENRISIVNIGDGDIPDDQKFSISYSKPVAKIKEKVYFKGLHPDYFPNGEYDVEIFSKGNSLDISCSTKESLSVSASFLVKNNGYLETIDHSSSNRWNVIYSNDNGLVSYSISSPDGLSIKDKYAKVYNENSPELYGLITYNHTPYGSKKSSKSKIMLVKFVSGSESENIPVLINPNMPPLATEVTDAMLSSYIPPRRPITEDEFLKMFAFMGQRGIYSFTTDYPSHMYGYDKVLKDQYNKNIEKGFLKAYGRYPEYFATVSSITSSFEEYDGGMKIIYTFNNDSYSNDELINMRSVFENSAKGYIHSLRAEGKITDSMSQKEKAKAIYTFIAQNFEYDEEKLPISHTAYGMVTNKKGVCEGYTALYNMMCRLEGISVQAVYGSADNGSGMGAHSWTLADLDGKRVHIDVTWGDPVGESLPKDYVDYYYFAKEDKDFKRNHKWDENNFGKTTY